MSLFPVKLISAGNGFPVLFFKIPNSLFCREYACAYAKKKAKSLNLYYCKLCNQDISGSNLKGPIFLLN